MLKTKKLPVLVVVLMLATILGACGDATATTAPTTAAATTTAAPKPTTAAATTTAAAATTTAAAATTTAAAATTTASAATTAAASGGSSDLVENYKPDLTSGKKGGTMVYTFTGQFPSNLQPFYVSEVTASTIWRQVYATLLGTSSTGKYYAYLLAQVPTTDNGGVKVSADGKTMDVNLKFKPGLKWSDGSPLTSKDLAFTWKWLLDKNNGSIVGADLDQWKLVTGVDTPDDTTAVLHFSTVYGPYLNFLNTIILPEKIWSKIDVKNAPKDPESTKPSVTSGPFKVDEYAKDDRIVLSRNDNFAPVWGGTAYLDKVVMRQVADANSALAAATNGEIDVVDNIDENLWQAAAKVPNAQGIIVPQYSYEFLEYNMTNPLFQDIAVRKAVDLAVDKDALIKQFRTPKTSKLPTSITPVSIYYNTELQPTKYDVAGANKLLDDAGWKAGSDGIRVKDGKKLAFTLVTTTAAVRKSTAEVMLTYWKAIGADVKLQAVASTELFGPWANDGILAKGKYDVAMFAFTQSVDPDGSYPLYISTGIATDANNGVGQNRGRISNPDLDKLLNEQRTTLDSAKRKQIWNQIQKILYDNQWESYLYTRVSNLVVSNKVKNFKPNPSSDTNFWNTVEVSLG